MRKRQKRVEHFVNSKVFGKTGGDREWCTIHFTSQCLYTASSTSSTESLCCFLFHFETYSFYRERRIENGKGDFLPGGGLISWNDGTSVGRIVMWTLHLLSFNFIYFNWINMEEVMEYLKLWTTEGTRQEKIKMKILFQPQHIFILDVQPRQRATSFLFIFKLEFIIFFCYNVLPIFFVAILLFAGDVCPPIRAWWWSDADIAVVRSSHFQVYFPQQ